VKSFIFELDILQIVKLVKELITYLLIYFNRFLVTGLTFRQIRRFDKKAFVKTTVSNIAMEVCKAIWNTLKYKHMPTPTVDTFKKIALEFYEKWNFPN